MSKLPQRALTLLTPGAFSGYDESNEERDGKERGHAKIEQRVAPRAHGACT
jgi:hypothetical protein